jgi:transposase
MTVIIGVDPHKSTHTAVAIDGDEQPLARVQLVADRCQVQRLLAWVEPLGTQRTWAVESAEGLGKLLAQQLLEAGEQVIDVPPTLAARVRLLGSTKAGKNDPNDALATAIAGLRHCGLRAVRVEDHTAVIRMVIDRYDDLVALRTQAACRLHVGLRELIAGGAPRRLGAERAAQLLRSVRPHGAAGVERKRLALELVADVRRLDRAIATTKRRVSDAVTASGTSLLELHGVGPIVAGFILGHAGDPARFPTPARFAPPPSKPPAGPAVVTGSTHAATASSTTRFTWPPSPRSATTPPAGPTTSARSPRGSRRRKRCALSSAASAMPSGASSKSTWATADNGPGRTTRDDSLIQRGRLNPEHRHFGTVTPGPDHHATPAPTALPRRAPKQPLDTKRLRSAPRRSAQNARHRMPRQNDAGSMVGTAHRSARLAPRW